MTTFNYSLELLQNSSISELATLQKLDPEFISITYTNHALSFFETTFTTALTLRKTTHIKTVIHLPATSFTKKELTTLLAELDCSPIDSVLVLSGDQKINKKSIYTSALELTRFLGNELPHLNILCSCHPETITSKVDLQKEIDLMKAKESAGCKIFISQIFFDNTSFVKFVKYCRATGIKAQIRAGIMPIINKNQVSFVEKVLKIQLPHSFKNIENNTDLRKVGIQFALSQIKILKNKGVANFHFFTMNDLETIKILIDGVL